MIDSIRFADSLNRMNRIESNWLACEFYDHRPKRSGESLSTPQLVNWDAC